VSAWPKGARHVPSITLRYADDFADGLGGVDLTMHRMNRSTGYVDLTSLGWMTVEDFRKFAAHVADVMREVNGEKTLVENFGIRKS
jgi:hypothetical protein